ncbi:uncharacterized protein LOC108051210 [Drosophila rhopaloa]|uniref:Uncharacterized protein LOC108051210 n=1 Tax=Drosophila rhopaloa TaxID=1041015 RepID=A0A6P4FU68_DRORH|nr:uncharacterized protein LOC108051210 [Drosophila rhopaloa]
MRGAIAVFLFVSVFLVSENEAAVAVGFFEDPAHPGKCVLEGLILDAGQTARNPNKCERIVCSANSMAQIQSCGVYGLAPGQQFGEYLTPNGDYPACCERKVISV